MALSRICIVLLSSCFLKFIRDTVGAAVQCEISRKPFAVEHDVFCDKYYVCDDGKATLHTCEDGLVFDVKKETCDLPHTVNCGQRTELQDPRPTLNCPRRNGMFEVDGSCDQFSHCTDGLHTLIRCPPGIIFSPELGTCVHPDQTNRPNCTADAVLDFVCPVLTGSSAPLRFGDHDRLPHPTNCRLFYMCLMTGQPRQGGCSVGLVFNPVNGRCDRPKNVAGCEDYYGDPEDDEDEELIDPFELVQLPDDNSSDKGGVRRRQRPARVRPTKFEVQQPE